MKELWGGEAERGWEEERKDKGEEGVAKESRIPTSGHSKTEDPDQTSTYTTYKHKCIYLST